VKKAQQDGQTTPCQLVKGTSAMGGELQFRAIVRRPESGMKLLFVNVTAAPQAGARFIRADAQGLKLEGADGA
jgi:hypothetical protein